MKILIVINSLAFGGAEKQAVTDILLLREKGFEVDLFYQKNGKLNDYIPKNVKTIQTLKNNIFLQARDLLTLIKKNNYDIVHAHMFWAEKISAIASLFVKFKLLFNEHGLGLWRKFYHTAIMWVISKKADLIVCSCQLNLQYRISNDKIKKKKLKVLYNSFNFKEIRPSSLNKDHFVIGFIGRFHKVKRLDMFINLALFIKDKIKNVKFLLVGDGEEMSTLKKMISDNNLQDIFELPGFASNTKAYFQEMNLFVLPSRIEAFSVALLEAGSHGLPSIAFNVGGNSEIIKDGINGYIVEDGNLKKVADLILKLYNDPELWEQFSRNSVKESMRFTDENRLEALIITYKELINETNT